MKCVIISGTSKLEWTGKVRQVSCSPFDTDLCCMYVISRSFHHVITLFKCCFLWRMQHIFYTNNTEAARNAQTLGGKPLKSSENL